MLIFFCKLDMSDEPFLSFLSLIQERDDQALNAILLIFRMRADNVLLKLWLLVYNI